jgi:hypothetical protein
MGSFMVTSMTATFLISCHLVDYDHAAQPQLMPITRFDSKELPPCIPSHAIIPVWLGKPSGDVTLPEARILLSDFGETFYPLDENNSSPTPR